MVIKMTHRNVMTAFVLTTTKSCSRRNIVSTFPFRSENFSGFYIFKKFGVLFLSVRTQIERWKGKQEVTLSHFHDSLSVVTAISQTLTQ